MRSLLAISLAAALSTPATAAYATQDSTVRAPGRVEVLSARTTSTTATLRWRAPAGGPRPTAYQVRVGSGRWKVTERTRYRVKGLRPDRAYRISIRAVRQKQAGAAVVVRAFT